MSGNLKPTNPNALATGNRQGQTCLLFFTGTYYLTIDAKNRLAVPSEVRRRLQAAADATVPGAADAGAVVPVFMYVTLGQGNSLWLYTEKDFEKRAADLNESQMDADDLLDYEQMLFPHAERIEVDAQGRIRVPDSLHKLSKLGTDVVVIGMNDHLEVRDRQQWQSHVEKTLAANPKILMNPRRAMRLGKAASDVGA